MPRRIKKAVIRHISLVPRGANRMPVLFKSEDNTIEFDPIVKASMEEGTLTAVVYAPEHRDSQGDIASAEVIKDAAYNFSKSGEGIDIRHDGKTLPKSAVFPAESFIIQKGDPRFADMKDYDNNPVDVTGGWGVVLKIEDENLRQLYRDGKWSGISMGGTGLVEVEKQSEEGLISSLINLLKSALGRSTDSGDTDMKPEDITKALEGNNKTLLDGFRSLFKEAGVIKDKSTETVVNKDKAKKPAPIFKGDASNLEDIAAHKRALRIWKVENQYDMADPEQFEKAMAEIEKIEAEFSPSAEDDAAAGIEKSDSPEVKTLKRQLLKAQRGSNQGEPPARGTAGSEGSVNLGKEDNDLVTAGATAMRNVLGYGKK